MVVTCKDNHPVACIGIMYSRLYWYMSGRLYWYMYSRLYWYMSGHLYWYMYSRLYWCVSGRLQILRPYHSYTTGSERCYRLSPAWKENIMLSWTGEVQLVLYHLVLLHNGVAVLSLPGRQRGSMGQNGRASWPICTASPTMGNCRPSRHTYSPMGTLRSSR